MPGSEPSGRSCPAVDSPRTGEVWHGGRVTWTPGLVALDIDGTIITDDGYLDPRTRDMILRVVERDVPVVLTTGRGWNATKPIADALSLPQMPSVCSNGAVLVSYPPEEIIEIVTFDASDLIDRVAEAHPDWLMAVEVVGSGYRVNRPFPDGELSGQIWVETPRQLGAERVTRVVLRDLNSTADEFARITPELNLHGVSYFIGYTAWIDIAPSDVDKAYGLGRVCDRLGIDPDYVLAVGDGFNDLEMFKFAGRAVAMGQSPDGVKRHADAVTGHVEQLGLVEELARWF